MLKWKILNDPSSQVESRKIDYESFEILPSTEIPITESFFKLINGASKTLLDCLEEFVVFFSKYMDCWKTTRYDFRFQHEGTFVLSLVPKKARNELIVQLRPDNIRFTDPNHRFRPDDRNCLSTAVCTVEDSMSLARYIIAKSLNPPCTNRLFTPTADQTELESRASALMLLKRIEIPTGVKTPKKIITSSSQFARNPAVLAYVLLRAVGRCELCKSDAPFQDSYGNPFLEVHHIIPLAEGGSDQVSNAVALCPNCHRRCHHSFDKNEVRQRLSIELIPILNC